ncbi:calcium/sodium antiporter [soil metagenome]
MTNLWFEFALCAAVIMFAGTKLTSHADVIADKTGLGRNWVGLILLATITSLPELIAGVSAVTLNDLPDMAVSGTLGSCMFNMLIVAGLDLVSRKTPVSLMVHQGHMLSAGFGIVLVTFAAIDILFGKHLPILTALNSIDPLSIAFVVVYFIAMKLIYSYEQNRLKEFTSEIAEATQPGATLGKSIAFFTLYSVLIVIAACFLPELGERIAKATGWGESFIGSSFIAITTSLPEVTVSLAAARLGAFDMAVANVLGSNLFNVVILAVVDAFYTKAPLLRSVSEINVLTALTAVISMAIVVISLTYRAEKRLLFLAGDAIAILLVYIMSNWLLFTAH